MSKKRGKAKVNRRPRGKRGHKPWCAVIGGTGKCNCGSDERGGRR